MMTLEETLNEALGFNEAFRRLHFSPDELFVCADPEKIFVALRTQGLEFIAVCGPNSISSDAELIQRWDERCHWWNVTATDDEREALWDRSFARARSGELVVKLVLKGFILPREHLAATVAQA